MQIRIEDLIKTSRPGSFQPPLQLPFFKEKLGLCFAQILIQYLEVTKNIRVNQNYFYHIKDYIRRLLIFINKRPHKYDSRWINRC